MGWVMIVGAELPSTGYAHNIKRRRVVRDAKQSQVHNGACLPTGTEKMIFCLAAAARKKQERRPKPATGLF